MLTDNIHKTALSKLSKGIEKAAEIVGPTMGAAGGNVAVQSKLPPYATTTNDGATIIQSIQLADPLETIGLNYLKEAVERSNSNSGDGSSTTTVLLNAILQEGIRALGENRIAPMQLKKELDETLAIIEKAIDDQTRQITVEEVPAVATIAGEDAGLATTLGEIYRVIGKDGIIHLEGSGTFDTSYKLIEGVRFQGTGYLSPYMVHDDDAQKNGRKETKAIYTAPSILVTKRKIGHINDINPLLAALQAQNKKDLVIFTDDMDSGVASMLIEAHKSKVINLLIIKAPVLWKNYIFEDFAKITGATIIEDASGITFKNLQLSHLGTCETIIVDKEETTVIGIADIAEHIKELEEEQTTDSKLRLSWLTTKTAILKLGAKSETELGYLRLKAEDSIHSSRLALKGGIVAGGGVALLNASRELPDTSGGHILGIALKAPIRQIINNRDVMDNEQFYYEGYGGEIGYNAKTGEEVNMFEANIIDAAIVVKRAIQNALGIASVILTVSSVITLPQEKEQQKGEMSFPPMNF